jgi:hypothetical protein
MQKLYSETFSKDLTFLIANQPNEHGINGQNFLSEWDDNSIGYGGNMVINQIVKNKDGDYYILRANNSSRCSDEDFKTKFIGKTLGKIKRNTSESVGQAQLGGSIAPHNFSYFEEIGYVTPDNKYRIAKYNYETTDPIEALTPTQFTKSLVKIIVDVYEVEFDEFIEKHGLGKSYNGWYSKSKLFKGLPFKIDYYGLIEFSRVRYQYRIGKQLKYELIENDEIVQSNKLSHYYFPSNCGNLIRHYIDMKQVSADDGDMLHIIDLDGEKYMGNLFTYETIRKSQTDKLQTLYRMSNGQQNIHPLHLSELDKPTVDVVSPDGTYIATIYLWPNSSQWPAEYNNRKWIFVLTPESMIPFARLKVKFRNTTFPIALRDLVKKIAKFHNLLADTSNVRLKKNEDAEIENYKNILKDTSHVSHAVTILNTHKLLNDNNLDSYKITQNDDSTYLFKLDLTFSDKHLQEWQSNQMDDEHLTELCARIIMPHKFKTITWVHGGNSDNLAKKLESILKSGKLNLNEIEKIQVIHKADLFIPNGWMNATIVYTNQNLI